MEISNVDKLILKNILSELIVEKKELFKDIIREILEEKIDLKKDKSDEVDILITNIFDRYDDVFKALA